MWSNFPTATDSLTKKLFGRDDIAQRAQHRIADHVGSPPGLAQLARLFLGRLVARRFIQRAKVANLGPVKVAQKQVSLDLCGAVGIVQDNTGQPHLGRRRRGQPALVRYRLTRDQQRVAAPLQGLADPEFKRTQLVAAKTQRHDIVALDEKRPMADLGPNPMELFERCRAVDQRSPGEATSRTHRRSKRRRGGAPWTPL